MQRAPTARSRNDLRDQLGVLDGLAALHYPHDRGLSFIVPVCRDPFVRRLVLLLGLLQLDLVDLDAQLCIFKACVVCKLISGFNFLALRFLAEDTVFCTGQGLECSLQFRIRCDKY